MLLFRCFCWLHWAQDDFTRTVRRQIPLRSAELVVNDLNWTKGIDPETGKPVEYNPKLDVQVYNPAARALRGDPEKRRFDALFADP